MRPRKAPEANCPRCGYRFQANTAVGEENHDPTPGDLSVCFHCGFVSVFTDELLPRPATREEMDALEPDVKQMLVRVEAARRMVTR